MTSSRMHTTIAGLLLIVSLGMILPAQAATDLQLCGTTQFADLVVIGAQVQDGSRLIVPSTWIQLVPHLYTLMGGGVIIRDPIEPGRFIGGLTVANESSFFGQHPICTVSPALEVHDPALPSFTGTAKILCVGGPDLPFQVTLNLTLIPCDEPGFPFGAVVSQDDGAESVRQLAAGDAPNEYQP